MKRLDCHPHVGNHSIALKVLVNLCSSQYQYDMMNSSLSNQTSAEANKRLGEDDEMKEIERECYKALLTVVKEIAAEIGINFTNTINIVALRYTFSL